MISTALIFKTVTKTVIYRLVEADIGYNRTSLIQTIFPEFSQKCEGGHVGYGLNKYREIGCWAGCFNVKNYGYICHPSLHLHLPFKSFFQNAAIWGRCGKRGPALCYARADYTTQQLSCIVHFIT